MNDEREMDPRTGREKQVVSDVNAGRSGTLSDEEQALREKAAQEVEENAQRRAEQLGGQTGESEGD